MQPAPAKASASPSAIPSKGVSPSTPEQPKADESPVAPPAPDDGLSEAAKANLARHKEQVDASVASVRDQLGLRSLELNAPLAVLSAESGDQAGDLLQLLTASLAQGIAALPADQKHSVASAVKGANLEVEVVSGGDTYEAKVSADGTLVIAYSFNSGAEDIDLSKLPGVVVEKPAPVVTAPIVIKAPTPVTPKAAPPQVEPPVKPAVVPKKKEEKDEKQKEEAGRPPNAWSLLDLEDNDDELDAIINGGISATKKREDDESPSAKVDGDEEPVDASAPTEEAPPASKEPAKLVPDKPTETIVEPEREGDADEDPFEVEVAAKPKPPGKAPSKKAVDPDPAAEDPSGEVAAKPAPAKPAPTKPTGKAPLKKAAKPEPVEEPVAEEPVEEDKPTAPKEEVKVEGAGAGGLSDAAKAEYEEFEPAILKSVANLCKALGLPSVLVLEAPLEALAAESGDTPGALLKELTSSLAKQVSALTAGQKEALAALISSPVLRVELVASGDVYEAKLVDTQLVIRYCFDSGSDEVGISSLLEGLVEDEAAAPVKLLNGASEPEPAPQAAQPAAKKEEVPEPEEPEEETPKEEAAPSKEEPTPEVDPAVQGLSAEAQQDYKTCKSSIDASLKQIQAELRLASPLVSVSGCLQSVASLSSFIRRLWTRRWRRWRRSPRSRWAPSSR